MTDRACPCQSGAPFDACCGPALAGAPAATAVALMRSRFTAYVVGDYAYLAATHAGLGPEAAVELARGARGLKWSRLEVRNVERGGPADDEGRVEFIARGRRLGRPHILHEVSRFTRVDGRWVYVDGELRAVGKSRKRVRR